MELWAKYFPDGGSVRIMEHYRFVRWKWSFGKEFPNWRNVSRVRCEQRITNSKLRETNIWMWDGQFCLFKKHKLITLDIEIWIGWNLRHVTSTQCTVYLLDKYSIQQQCLFTSNTWCYKQTPHVFPITILPQCTTYSLANSALIFPTFNEWTVLCSIPQ